MEEGQWREEREQGHKKYVPDKTREARTGQATWGFLKRIEIGLIPSNGTPLKALRGRRARKGVSETEILISNASHWVCNQLKGWMQTKLQEPFFEVQEGGLCSGGGDRSGKAERR